MPATRKRRKWMTEDELRALVEELARGGNMPACRFLFETWLKPEREEVTPDASDPLAEVDELAARRRAS
jgi:hypothetical protein